MDISTGQIYVSSCNSDIQLNSEISRIHPSEILIFKELIPNITVGNSCTITEVTPLNKQIKEKINIPLSPSENQSISILFNYLHNTGLTTTYFQPVERYIGNYAVEMSRNTRHSLEIIKNIRGTKEGSLLSVIDKTVTSLGGRLIVNRLSSPITQKKEIDSRLSVCKLIFLVC